MRGGAFRLVLTLAAAVFVAHLVHATTSPYGLHRDTYLYLAMGEHLRLWSMDFPPFIALVAEATRTLFGDSQLALALGPAAAHSALVVLAGLMAREMGGRWSPFLLALAVASAPLYMRAGVLFQPVVFDQLWWTLSLLLLLRIGRADEATAVAGAAAPRVAQMRRWVLLGVVLGLGLLTKFTLLVLGLGILVALLVVKRHLLAGPGPWLAAALAFVVGSPSLVGQIRLGFPVLGQVGDLQASQLARVSPVDFLMGSFFEVGPVVLLSAVGVVAVFLRSELRPFRLAVLSAAAAYATLLVVGGKSYYAGPVFPLLMATGAVAVEGWVERRRARGSRLALSAPVGLYGVVALWGVVSLPLGMPVLGPDAMARYANRLGVAEAVTTNVGLVLTLPQDYADMLGWEALVAGVAEVYHDLPDADREEAVILASNYGEAGAIDFHGPALGLPKAVAPVGSYWFFGPGTLPGEVVVTVGLEADDLAGYFATAVEAMRVKNRWGVPEEQDVPIVVARGPSRTLQELWPGFAGRN